MSGIALTAREEPAEHAPHALARTSADGRPFTAAAMSHDAGNQRLGMPHVVHVGGAEALAHPDLLVAQLEPEAGGDQRKRQQAAPLADDQRRAEQTQQDAGVDRMAYPAVRADHDQRVILLQLHRGAPVAPQRRARPAREAQAEQQQDQAQPSAAGRKSRHNHSSPAHGRFENNRAKPSSSGTRYTSIVPRRSTRAARLVPNALTNQYSSQAAQIRETTMPKGKDMAVASTGAMPSACAVAGP